MSGAENERPERDARAFIASPNSTERSGNALIGGYGCEIHRPIKTEHLGSLQVRRVKRSRLGGRTRERGFSFARITFFARTRREPTRKFARGPRFLGEQKVPEDDLLHSLGRYGVD